MRNYIFIHVPKTGGRSISSALNHIDVEHKNIKSYIQTHGKTYVSNTFKFSVVRNPWDRMWSYFKCFILDKRPDLDIYYYNFNQWIIDGMPSNINTNNKTPVAMGLDHISFYKDNSDIIRIDYFIRFEELQYGFNEVCHNLNIEPRILPVIGDKEYLALLNKYPYIEYDYKQQYTSQEAIDTVYLKNIEIINMFNYDF